MTVLYRAALDTRHFAFEAYGDTEEAARYALQKGLGAPLRPISRERSLAFAPITKRASKRERSNLAAPTATASSSPWKDARSPTKNCLIIPRNARP